MTWAKQPFLGIWTFSLAYIITTIWLTSMPKIGFDATDVGMNWIFVWFSVGFGYQIFWDVWPFSNMKQPLGGIIAGIVSIVICSFVWKLLLNWFEAGDAYAYLSYTQFFVFAYGWFWHNWPFDKMAQPGKGIIFTALSIVFGLVVFKIIGPIAESYIFYLPLWLFYVLEGWPFSKLPQPFHGLGVCVGTIAMTAVAYPIFYGLFQAPEWSIVTWSYTAWVFFAILVWYTPPRLVTQEATENAPETGYKDGHLASLKEAVS